MKKSNSLRIYFQLLEVFTIREIKSRYKASLLGPIWIILYPLFTAIILNFIFGKFIKIKTGGIPYFLFVLSGLVIWNFFQGGLNLAKDSLVWNRELITKSSFSKSVLPLSYVLSKTPDFVVYLLILLFFYMGNYTLHPNFFLIIFSIIPIFFFTTGIAFVSSIANAAFRDFGRIIEFCLMILFYATPIIFPHTLIPDKYKLLIIINPLAHLIIFTRELLFKNKVRFDLFFLSFLISICVFFIGIYIFKRFEKKIADLI